MTEKVPNSERISEFWTAIKTQITLKITEALQDYATNEGVATAISAVLQDYVKNEDLILTIQNALDDYMTSSEVTEAIAQAVGQLEGGGITTEIKDNIPTASDARERVIYFVKNDKEHENNVYDEYMLINGKIEKIGSTEIDFNSYWSKTELIAMTSEELQAIIDG